MKVDSISLISPFWWCSQGLRLSRCAVTHVISSISLYPCYHPRKRTVVKLKLVKERLWDEVKVDKMFIIYYHKHCWKMPNSCCDSIKKKKKLEPNTFSHIVLQMQLSITLEDYHSKYIFLSCLSPSCNSLFWDYPGFWTMRRLENVLVLLLESELRSLHNHQLLRGLTLSVSINLSAEWWKPSCLILTLWASGFQPSFMR